MSKGYSLHVGLTHVDPSAYRGWSGACDGPDQDVRIMRSILSEKGYAPTTLVNSSAKKNNVQEELERHADRTSAGDIFVFCFSGHGGQQRDFSGDESDALDETLCCFDGHLLDDDLSKLIAKFKEGVRVITVCDSCNSQTVNEKPVGFRHFSGGEESYGAIKAQVLHLAGCRDGEESLGNARGGVLTRSIQKAMALGPSNYAKLYEAVQINSRRLVELAGRYQAPQFVQVANVSTGFLAQKPFQISAPEGMDDIPEFEGPKELELSDEVKARIKSIVDGAAILAEKSRKLEEEFGI